MVNVAPGGQSIQMNVDEMTTIYKYLEEILNTFRNDIQANSQNIQQLQYYKDGKATPVVKEYEHILNKTMEIGDHYERIMSLVAYTLQSMMATDEQLGQEIIRKIGG
ncbi:MULTISPECIES: hypothetical protein [Bacillus cereus group]|uniref:WXG100 family type VII secretion target n=1 Tax=Bacillus mycoides TaxID=1405 RepID=A0ABX6Z0M4_BACMY|nr:hypothetical protein [Bacillus mycoides]AJH16816.1 hypothetical protein BG05_5790 [Bacillus mycoides]KUH41121.1 hypothetical protein M2E15_3280 [Bacillus mycoides]MDR4239362.1 hypothetical protein [Bacillus mycoides]MED1431014.1 hypothetical protein [Bacillus mycoides]MED1487357.1 hypothetical protein [Bacillus mycoides]